MATTSLPHLHRRPPSILLFQCNPSSRINNHTLLIKSSSEKRIVSCSFSSLRDPVSVNADEFIPGTEDSYKLDAFIGSEENLNFRGCKTCGREEVERGCNGEGRIQGGIATVPGFGWWPIKAYRPCPGFIASGGRYKRRGQSMDEVAFGRIGTNFSANLADNAQPGKKKQSNRKPTR
ncbi:hypothetical protein HPP92_002926 [Vanilla planifolia]|uniref:Uncharacterized protein n=1 Tax=Vanilla planifolia TaxID=51239 RepID=A0A835VIG4_VANPL|nr:hypothetical protein HPP92_002926 [Vanilla planifolia]